MEKLENPMLAGKKDLEQFLERVRALPLLAPKEIFARLEELGCPFPAKLTGLDALLAVLARGSDGLAQAVTALLGV